MHRCTALSSVRISTAGMRPPSPGPLEQHTDRRRTPRDRPREDLPRGEAGRMEISMERKRKQKLGVNRETIRQIEAADLATAAGGGMCSTAAPTGMCCTQSKTCNHTN